MKKIVFTLFLACIFVSSLSVNTLGEGGIPIGGRTDCGKPDLPPCPVAAPIEPTEDATFYKTVIDYLAQLFG